MEARERRLTIGRLAKSSEVGVETVRFYERKGLIRQPGKGSGFREYPAGDIARIRFIKRAQELGFKLREVKGLLDLQSSRASCSSVKRRADQKIAEIGKRIRDLKAMQRRLNEISSCCAAGDSDLSKCSILDCFEGRC